MASVYSVSRVNRYISGLFAEDFALSKISVKGEVSNCKYHPSGHIYFTLKDESSALSAVLFAGNRSGLTFHMENGQQVIVTGRIQVYERAGSYQLYASQIRQDGQGDLYLRFQEQKKYLEEMGMFSEAYKQPIPPYIQTLGVVTASTGAAVRDIIQITKRRNPFVQILLYPALVQGDGAAESICKGIRTLDGRVDCMIIGRGGGSMEDLWAFNEESVARAIFDCETPIISAVGHETLRSRILWQTCGHRHRRRQQSWQFIRWRICPTDCRQRQIGCVVRYSGTQTGAERCWRSRRDGLWRCTRRVGCCRIDSILQR